MNNLKQIGLRCTTTTTSTADCQRTFDKEGKPLYRGVAILPLSNSRITGSSSSKSRGTANTIEAHRQMPRPIAVRSRAPI
jgi:hypothetical protein